MKPDVNLNVWMLYHPFTNSLFLSQEFGQTEQTAQTLMLCAGHMTDPCWRLLMTLEKCTCSPTPALNQGSVGFSHRHAASVFLSFLSFILLLYWHVNELKLFLMLCINVDLQQPQCFFSAEKEISKHKVFVVGSPPYLLCAQFLLGFYFVLTNTFRLSGFFSFNKLKFSAKPILTGAVNLIGRSGKLAAIRTGS